MSHCDVIIIGAGPYGLSVAAHLRAVQGLDTRIFGKPMSFWQNNMPAGMFLRSNWTATEIASPGKRWSLEAFQRESGRRFGTPVPLEQFVAYGQWFQHEAVPDLDSRYVARVSRMGHGFKVVLDDGETITANRIIVAGGIASFARRPAEFARFPREIVSHTVDHQGYSSFSGQLVLIIGGGQSALESAALLHEAGAEVEVVTRSKHIHWLQGWASQTLHHGMGKFTSRLLYAPTDVGPAGLSQLLARPDLVRKLPRNTQEKLRRRATRPAGAHWLINRLRDVPIRLGQSVSCVTYAGDKLKARLEDGTERVADHILLGTGFHIDISKYEFLSPDIMEHIRRSDGFPILNEGFETSVPGLHMVGAPAIWSYGPLLQFVSGTHYASLSLTNAIRRGAAGNQREQAASHVVGDSLQVR